MVIAIGYGRWQWQITMASVDIGWQLQMVIADACECQWGIVDDNGGY